MDGSRAAPAGPGLRSLDLPPLVERILAARGMTAAADVDRFRNPKLLHLHDPALLPGACAAAARLVAAVRNDERIVIYGDYDVDGITATAILFRVLTAVAPDVRLSTYVPHRLEEGYGINVEALRQLRADGADLVISVDCGIGAIEPARVAKSLGLDLIITDHHNPPAPALPDALLVHPRLPGAYPFGELCGAGVAFKVAWQFAKQWRDAPRVEPALQQTLLDLLPLVALGTIADVVPLVDENRVLATYGLQLIKQTPIPGLRALIEASELMDEGIDCQKVGFVLGPKLNACGRMGHAAEAVRMLTDAPADEAARIAENLSRLNRERQQTERKVLDHAARLAEDAGMTEDDRRAIVLADPSWHPGVIGIVCSRLVERFGRPTILLERGDDTCRGSARSVDGYSIHDALHACAEHLESYGGHHAAAGLALRTADLPAFTEALVAHANAHIDAESLTPSVTIDCDAELHEMSLLAVQQIAALSPFGRANPRPVVRVRRAVLAEPPRQMGGGGKHLSLRIRQDHDGRRRVLRCVWWSRGALAADLVTGMCVDAVIEPKLNVWNGRTSVEAVIRDVRIAERGATDAGPDITFVEGRAPQRARQGDPSR